MKKHKKMFSIDRVFDPGLRVSMMEGLMMHKDFDRVMIACLISIAPGSQRLPVREIQN